MNRRYKERLGEAGARLEPRTTPMHRTRLSFRDQFLHTLDRRGRLLPEGDTDFAGR
jgi:hypothetical protein